MGEGTKKGDKTNGDKRDRERMRESWEEIRERKSMRAEAEFVQGMNVRKKAVRETVSSKKSKFRKPLRDRHISSIISSQR